MSLCGQRGGDCRHDGTLTRRGVVKMVRCGRCRYIFKAESVKLGGRWLKGEGRVNTEGLSPGFLQEQLSREDVNSYDTEPHCV